MPIIVITISQILLIDMVFDYLLFHRMLPGTLADRCSILQRTGLHWCTPEDTLIGLWKIIMRWIKAIGCRYSCFLTDLEMRYTIEYTLMHSGRHSERAVEDKNEMDKSNRLQIFLLLNRFGNVIHNWIYIDQFWRRH